MSEIRTSTFDHFIAVFSKLTADASFIQNHAYEEEKQHMRDFRSTWIKQIGKALVLGALSIPAISYPALADEDKFTLGLVTFLSGPAAGPAGIPARNAADLIIDAINAGELPSPYSGVGIAGAKIEPVFVDENSKQKVADFKKLVSKDSADAVVGYISSGSCKAIAPIAEEENALTVFVSCGTPQIFEDIVLEPEYVFRSTGHATSGAVGAARYLEETISQLGSISGLNQNYAWGHDSWRDFSLSLKELKQEIDITNEQFPKIFAGQYGSEITSLLTNGSDVVHSSLWGGDLEAFVIQASSRGLFDRSRLVLTADVPLEILGNRIPDGTVLAARGMHNVFQAENELNKWFNNAYIERFGSEPIGASFQMAQGILAVKAASEKAGSAVPKEIAASLQNLSFLTPEGPVNMSLSEGHQATIDVAYGEYRWNEAQGKGELINVRSYAADCVNPPAKVKSLDWIAKGLAASSCP